jgi:hypothetical protein
MLNGFIPGFQRSIHHENKPFSAWMSSINRLADIGHLNWAEAVLILNNQGLECKIGGC